MGAAGGRAPVFLARRVKADPGGKGRGPARLRQQHRTGRRAPPPRRKHCQSQTPAARGLQGQDPAASPGRAHAAPLHSNHSPSPGASWRRAGSKRQERAARGWAVEWEGRSAPGVFERVGTADTLELGLYLRMRWVGVGAWGRARAFKPRRQGCSARPAWGVECTNTQILARSAGAEPCRRLREVFQGGSVSRWAQGRACRAAGHACAAAFPLRISTRIDPAIGVASPPKPGPPMFTGEHPNRVTHNAQFGQPRQCCRWMLSGQCRREERDDG